MLAHSRMSQNFPMSVPSGVPQMIPTSLLSGNPQCAPMTVTWGAPHCVPVCTALGTQHNVPMMVPSGTPQYVLMGSNSSVTQNVPIAAYFGAPQYVAMAATAGTMHHVPIPVSSEKLQYVMMEAPSATPQYVMMVAPHETVTSRTSWNVPTTASSGTTRNVPIFDSRNLHMNASLEASQYINSSPSLHATDTQSSAYKEKLGVDSASTDFEPKSMIGKKNIKGCGKKKPQSKQKRVETQANAQRLLQLEAKVNELLEMRTSVKESTVPAKEISGLLMSKHKHKRHTLEVQSLLNINADEIKQELPETGENERWSVASETDPVEDVNVVVKEDNMKSEISNLGKKKRTKRTTPSRLRRHEARAEARRLGKLIRKEIIQLQGVDSEAQETLPQNSELVPSASPVQQSGSSIIFDQCNNGQPHRKHKYRGKRAGKNKKKR